MSVNPYRHPEISEYPNGFPVPVNDAQALLWEGKGWVQVEAGRVDYSRMRKGQLQDAAEDAGLEIPEKVTVAQLRELLETDQEKRLAALKTTPGAEVPADEGD